MLENLSFCRHIDGGKGIVENHERPAMEKRAGQGDASLLTAGEALASFADRRLNSFGEGRAVLVHTDFGEDLGDVAGKAEANVFFKACRK